MSLKGKPDIFMEIAGKNYDNILQIITTDKDAVNLRDHSKYTPLMIAVERNNIELAKMFIEHGANVNYLRLNYCSALNLAAKIRSPEIVILLLENGADPNLGNSPAIMSAVGADEFINERRLVPKKIDEAVDEIIKMLIEHGADINAADSEGRTALMYCLSMYPHNYMRLIEAGADINAKMKTGFTCLMTAGKKQCPVLLDLGADADTANQEGRNALFYFNDLASIKRLHKAGADPVRADNNGITPLMHHCYYGNLTIIKWLLKFKESIGKVSNGGGNALINASVPIQNAPKDIIGIVEILVKAGEDPNIVTKFNETLLTKACQTVNVDLLRMALKYGNDVNQRLLTGETGLFLASGHDNAVDVVETLLNAGADPSIKNNSGKTALDNAVEFNCTEIIELLKKSV